MSNSINPFKDDITGRLLLGRYRVVRRLAAGGMGVVYLARLEGAAGFAKPVVVKLVLPILQSNDEFSGMFAREARILAGLQHPGIVGIIEFAEDLDCYIMVLEYVNGFSLGDWKRFLASKKRMIPTDTAIQIAINTLDALHYAHTLKNQAGEKMLIVHRDISPGNIMLDVEGRIKLVDFGIAFIAEANEGYRTADRSFKGKLCYSSPELFSSGKASPASDVYALGVTLHEILVGTNEFNLKDHAKVVHAVLNHVPSSIHMVRDDAPAAIDEVLRKALAKKPEHRFTSAQEFATALREITTVPEHRALEQLGELVREDFNEEMSAYLNMESLASRENAWRFPSITPSAPAAPPPLTTTAETSQEREAATVAATTDSSLLRDISAAGLGTLDGPTVVARPQPPSSKEGGRKGVFFAIVGAVLLAGAAALVFTLTRKPPPDDRRFLLVQSDLPADLAPTPVETTEQAEHPVTPVTSATATDTAPAEADSAPEPSTAKEPKERKGARGKQKAPADEVTRLTAAFKKQRHKIQSCFESDPKATESHPTVSVLFTVNPAGKVDTTSLTPSSVENTGLGRCLLKVSRATTFPKRDSAVSFRIPVSARRVSR